MLGDPVNLTCYHCTKKSGKQRKLARIMYWPVQWTAWGWTATQRIMAAKVDMAQNEQNVQGPTLTRSDVYTNRFTLLPVAWCNIQIKCFVILLGRGANGATLLKVMSASAVPSRTIFLLHGVCMVGACLHSGHFYLRPAVGQTMKSRNQIHIVVFPIASHQPYFFCYTTIHVSIY